jgi:hypothetical protein
MLSDRDVRIRLSWDADENADNAYHCTLAELFDDNEELGPDERRTLRALHVGEKFHGGGGAAGAFTVERVA